MPANALVSRRGTNEPALPSVWSLAGGQVVENEGVLPDIKVEQLPADMLAGRDPQLEKAMEIIMKEPEKNPPPRPLRPRYPVRVRKPS